MTPERERVARLLLLAYALAALTDLSALLAHGHTAQLLHIVAKPLLMPLLAALVYARGAPGLLVAALLLGWGGDTLLLIGADPAFLAGMALFAAGHVCYLVLFGRGRTNPYLGAGYAVALAATAAVLLPALPGGLRIPVAGYSLLLTAMAYRASGRGPVAGLGGALFLVSDTLIATGIADLPQPPLAGFWVMVTYLTAQSLLAAGVIRYEGAASPTYGDTRTSV
ncbi:MULTISPECIES: lysoplasmalogenase [unclassified Streptomyces]|uniref:lysoplasmalogenase n=1 Tax=unclassified Streptomyces TaxID=2593676 RepID=UPI003247A58D